MIIGVTLLGIAIFLIPITTYLIYLSYHQIRKLIGIYIAEKNYPIDRVNFKYIPLRPVRSDIYIQEWEHALIIFDVSKTRISSNQKMYTGSTVGGIKIPFANTSFTSRKFYNKKGYTKYGESRVYVTNTSIRVYCYDEPHRWAAPIHAIVSTHLVGYGKSVDVEIQNEDIKDRFRIDFLSTREAVFFMNVVWNIKHNGWRYYNYMSKESEEYKDVEEKQITRWDVRRYNKELAMFPELKEKSWLEIEEEIRDKASWRKVKTKMNPKKKEIREGSGMERALECDEFVTLCSDDPKLKDEIDKLYPSSKKRRKN